MAGCRRAATPASDDRADAGGLQPAAGCRAGRRQRDRTPAGDDRRGPRAAVRTRPPAGGRDRRGAGSVRCRRADRARHRRALDRHRWRDELHLSPARCRMGRRPTRDQRGRRHGPPPPDRFLLAQPAATVPVGDRRGGGNDAGGDRGPAGTAAARSAQAVRAAGTCRFPHASAEWRRSDAHCGPAAPGCHPAPGVRSQPCAGRGRDRTAARGHGPS